MVAFSVAFPSRWKKALENLSTKITGHGRKAKRREAE
jgi:hypothetical protein